MEENKQTKFIIENYLEAKEFYKEIVEKNNKQFNSSEFVQIFSKSKGLDKLKDFFTEIHNYCYQKSYRQYVFYLISIIKSVIHFNVEENEYYINCVNELLEFLELTLNILISLFPNKWKTTSKQRIMKDIITHLKIRRNIEKYSYEIKKMEDIYGFG